MRYGLVCLLFLGCHTETEERVKIKVTNFKTSPFNFTTDHNKFADEPLEEWEGLEHHHVPYLIPNSRWIYTNHGDRIGLWGEEGEDYGKRMMGGGSNKQGNCWCTTDNPRWKSNTDRESCLMCDSPNPSKGDCNCAECRCIGCGYTPKEEE